MKKIHTILITYDLVKKIEVDLSLNAIQALYGSGCFDENFMQWTPQRLAMQVRFRPDDLDAQQAAICTAALALESLKPRGSKISNVQIWIDGRQVDNPQNAAQYETLPA